MPLIIGTGPVVEHAPRKHQVQVPVGVRLSQTEVSRMKFSDVLRQKLQALNLRAFEVVGMHPGNRSVPE